MTHDVIPGPRETTADARDFETIARADDPRLEPFRAIRERDLTRRGGFIAEGTVVLEALLRSGRFRPTSLLLMRNRVAGLAALLDEVPSGVPVYVTDEATMAAVAGFHVHRGVLAHGVAREAASVPADLSALAREGAVVVVAVGIANHDNMGAIFRNACAFGARLLLLDGTSCDPLYRKALRVSVGSVLRLPFERLGEAGAIRARLEAAGFRCLALSPQGRPDLGAVLSRPGPVALFLGAEGPGLPAGLMAGMEPLRIDMAPGFDSLNVATAAAIVLQRLYSARAAGGG